MDHAFMLTVTRVSILSLGIM